MLTILQQIPFFESLDAEMHAALIRNIEMQYFPAGHTLFAEGEHGDKMYIIKTGEVGIYSTRTSKNPLAILKSNDFFGEMALVSNTPRNATARTLSETEIFVLHKGAFEELLRTNPEISAQISDEILRRINANNADFGTENNS